MPWHQILARAVVTPLILVLAVAAVITAPQLIIHAINSTSPALTTLGATTITALLAVAALLAHKNRKETQ